MDPVINLEVVDLVKPLNNAPSELAITQRARSMRVWYIWLAAFYALWLTLNFGFGYFQQTKEHWPIALAMALGSYVAGSTPMGGGTIGFPVLVLFRL